MENVNLSETFLYTSKEQKRTDINEELANLFISLFKKQDATFISIFGRRGTGKTALALLICEILRESGLIKNFATNTKVYSSPFPIKEITDLETLTYWSKTVYGRKLFLFDEIADAMSRRRPMAHLTVELLKKFNKLRKYKLSVIGTTITQKLLDRAVLDRDLLDATINKPLIENVKFALYQNLLNYDCYNLTDLPNTNIDFDSYDTSPFTDKPLASKRKFKDKDMALLWEWVNGKTSTELGLHSMQIHRKVKKVLKYFLEKEPHPSP